MIKDFGLNKAELCEREIRRSQIGRWTLRILGIGVFLAVTQTGLVYFMQNKLNSAIQEENQVEQQYQNIAKKLPFSKTMEQKAQEILKYRSNAENSFMPVGVYYAIADGLLPGMVVKEITLTENKLSTKTENNLTGEYLLKISIGYENTDIGVDTFIKNFDIALNKLYKGTVSRQGIKVTSGKALSIRNIIYTGRDITVSLKTEVGSIGSKRAKVVKNK